MNAAEDARRARAAVYSNATKLWRWLKEPAALIPRWWYGLLFLLSVVGVASAARLTLSETTRRYLAALALGWMLWILIKPTLVWCWEALTDAAHWQLRAESDAQQVEFERARNERFRQQIHRAEQRDEWLHHAPTPHYPSSGPAIQTQDQLAELAKGDHTAIVFYTADGTYMQHWLTTPNSHLFEFLLDMPATWLPYGADLIERHDCTGHRCQLVKEIVTTWTTTPVRRMRKLADA
jgi:hypothetical protein